MPRNEPHETLFWASKMQLLLGLVTSTEEQLDEGIRDRRRTVCSNHLPALNPLFSPPSVFGAGIGPNLSLLPPQKRGIHEEFKGGGWNNAAQEELPHLSGQPALWVVLAAASWGSALRVVPQN